MLFGLRGLELINNRIGQIFVILNQRNITTNMGIKLLLMGEPLPRLLHISFVVTSLLPLSTLLSASSQLKSLSNSSTSINLHTATLGNNSFFKSSICMVKPQVPTRLPFFQKRSPIVRVSFFYAYAMVKWSCFLTGQFSTILLFTTIPI